MEEEAVVEQANDPCVPGQEVINDEPPTKLEREANDSLMEFLIEQNCFEPEERAAKRAVVLGELQELVCQFITEVTQKLNIEPVDGVLPQAQLFAFGSYRLGVCSPSSDIDTLCVTPKFVKRTHFFNIFYQILSNCPKIHDLIKVESAYVPIMTMDYDGIDIDISFAPLDLTTIPDDINLEDDTLLNKLDPHAINSINGVRTNDMLLRLVPNQENFRIILRFIRIWSKARAIYGNVYGYLGGVNCALLCAFVCQRYPNANPSQLILMLFTDLAEWPNPEPIYINYPNEGPIELWNAADSTDVFQIITPAYPVINSIRSATKSSLQRMVEEFQRGAQLVDKVITKKRKWSVLIAPTNFFTKYRYYIKVDVSADTSDNFNYWFGTVDSKIKRLSVHLENVEGLSAAVVFPKGFETEPLNGSFFIAMTIETKAEDGATPTLDISEPTQKWLEEIMVLKKSPKMIIKINMVKKSQLPNYVFPDGVKPEPKKPKQKKGEGEGKKTKEGKKKKTKKAEKTDKPEKA